MCTARAYVRFVPIADMTDYSITSSALVNNVLGIDTPIAADVFKLTTKSNLASRESCFVPRSRDRRQFYFYGRHRAQRLGYVRRSCNNEKKSLRQCRLTGERIMLKHICATTLTLGFLVSSADAQLVTRKDLTADLAVTMAQAAISACKAQGHNVSATIVGRAGEVIVQIRGDGAGMHTFENSFRKAWTARSFRAPSGTIEQRLKDNPNLPLIHLTNVIADKGGLPIKVGDDTIGGVGVSGCPGCDEPCSQAGIDKVADQLK
jgi:uncharacterized protein GlcG (DUF336 family)